LRQNIKNRTTAEHNIPEAIQHMTGRCSHRIVNYSLSSNIILEKPTAHLAGKYLPTSMELDIHYCVHKKLQMDVSQAKLI
jgi:hypothetical protein